jgi:putative ABC transport system permease protein
LTGLIQDLRYGVRTLRKTPGFTVIALATLALGIGANTAIFSFVDGVLLKPLPYADADRIVRVLEKPPLGERNGISTLNFLDWRGQNTVFEKMAAQSGADVTLTGEGQAVQLRQGLVSAPFFDIFGTRPVLGRTFAADEDQPGKDHVVLLSHAIWQSQFGGDPNLIGKTIRLDGEPYAVIGVLPAGGSFDRAYNQIWSPLVFKPENMTRNFHWFGSFAKLKPGVTLGAARKQMDAIGARIAHDYPDSNKGWGVIVERFSDIAVGDDLKRSLYVLLAAVGMVLLITCANIANLTLVRGASRDREIAIRAALGGGRGRIVRQFLTESVLLAVCGGVLGLALGYAAMAALKAAIPPFTLPKEANVSLDARVLVFTFALSVLTGIVCGLAPAIAITRGNLADVMKDRARNSSAGTARKSLRGALVIAQVALAFVLLTGAGLLIRSFSRMLAADMGFDSTNVLTAELDIPQKRYPDPRQLNEYLRSIVISVESVPGVRDVAFTSALPLQGWGYGMPFQIGGQPMVDRANRQDCFFKMVGPSYFHVLGMRVLQGRGLSQRDTPGAPPVTVINETMARKYFSKQNPIGQRVLIQQIVPGKTQLGPEIPWEVVGVVADERVSSLDNKRDDPGIYVSNEQSPVYFGGLVVRASMNPAFVEKALRKAISDVNKEQVLSEVKTLDQLKSESMDSDRLRSILLGVFAAIALSLAAVGIYGVVSYTVAQRTNEMGIRAALGATAGRLIALALRGGMWMMAAGLALGLAGSLAFARLLSTLLFGVGAWDAATILGVAILLAAIGLAACWIPARRAARVDPLVALRYE